MTLFELVYLPPPNYTPITTTNVGEKLRFHCTLVKYCINVHVLTLMNSAVVPLTQKHRKIISYNLKYHPTIFKVVCKTI